MKRKNLGYLRPIQTDLSNPFIESSIISRDKREQNLSLIPTQIIIRNSIFMKLIVVKSQPAAHQ